MSSACELAVGCPKDSINSWARPHDKYLQPFNSRQAEQLRSALQRLQDGNAIPVRGRDHGTSEAFTEFDYGVAIKIRERLLFIYESGDVEDLQIDELDLRDLVHFVVTAASAHRKRRPALPPTIIHPSLPKRLIVLSHGFSPDVGPDYPIIRKLEAVAHSRGWGVIVPDYRESYLWKDESRSREARVRILLELLVCVEGPKPETIVLVGHSQGGACSALAARNQQLVEAIGIKGLFLLGSENAARLDKMIQPPALPTDNIRVVHADLDGVISYSEAASLIRGWRLPSSCLVTLRSNTPPGAVDSWGDDVAHDFLSQHLMQGAVTVFETFLSQQELKPTC